MWSYIKTFASNFCSLSLFSEFDISDVDIYHVAVSRSRLIIIRPLIMYRFKIWKVPFSISKNLIISNAKKCPFQIRKSSNFQKWEMCHFQIQKMSFLQIRECTIVSKISRVEGKEKQWKFEENVSMWLYEGKLI